MPLVESELGERRIIMNESTTRTTKQFTGCASLAAVGVKLRELKLFEPIGQRVQIAQKTIKDRPTDKLYDAFISLLAGAHGLVEINTRLRADIALQRAFGRSRCAEQSVVQDTLNACTAENVEQMEQAMDSIYRQHSQGHEHDYQASFQVLDVDMSGLPCGPKAAFASKGYFAKQRNRRGRQLGRVLASSYEEIVVDRLFDGKTQLTRALQPLMQAAEETLQLDEDKRRRTIVRVDAGGGSLDDVNWLLARDKQGLGISKRSKKRFAAQQMVMLLGSLAHNVIIWAHRWLASPALHQYGMLRMVRDVFHISGFLLTDALGQVVQIVLNQAAPLAPTLVDPLCALLARTHVAVNLGQT